MLTPEMLRRKAAEAAERLARERQLEEERRQREEAVRRREEEARRREEERRKQLEAERVHLQKLARATVTRLWVDLVKTSVQGAQSIRIPVEDKIAPIVVSELEPHGFRCRIKRLSNWHEQARERLSRLLMKLPGSEDGLPVRDKLTQALESRQLRSENLLDFLRRLSTEPRTKSWGDVSLYLNTNVIPHFESTHDQSLSTHVRIAWAPVDLATTLLDSPQQLPFWIVSTSGSGLIQRIGQSLASDAERGLTATHFDLLPLPIVPDRWGPNKMTKFVHSGHAIGVTPFSSEIMANVLAALGFKANGSNQARLDVAWG